MSKKLIIDTIRQDFKGKAWNEKRKQCMYKTDCGKKCAVGLFIPDGHDAQESLNEAEYMLHAYPDLMEHMPSQDIHFMQRFQNKHDSLDAELSVEEQQDILIDWIERYYDSELYNHEGERQ